MHDKQQILKTREFAALGVHLCEGAIQIGGRTLKPDETKAYVEFKISHSWPARSAYGVASHPQTVANSYQSMQDQVFNLGHQMKAYSAPKESAADPEEFRRDWILGSVAAVELMNAPMGSRLPKTTDQSTYIRGAAVIFKKAERVPKILGEHLSGRHNWTVSLEATYSLLESGFVLQGEPKKKSVRDLVEKFTPNDFASEELSYVPFLDAPDELIGVYNFDERRVTQDWEGLKPTVLKGGINGAFHYGGVGLVRYGAEREAEIQQIMASDPDRIWEESGQNPESGTQKTEEFAAALEYFERSQKEFARLCG